jgi:hypothetical protein
MSEIHLLITRRGTLFVLEATHGADRVALLSLPFIQDVRAAARDIAARTLDEHTGRPFSVVDRSGVE